MLGIKVYAVKRAKWTCFQAQDSVKCILFTVRRELSMYAIISTGGKQYRVTKGQYLKIEKLPTEIGAQVDFDNVLLVSDGEDLHVGAPFVENAKVVAEVTDQSRAKKVEIIKFKRRKHHMKRQGHRQYYTSIKVTDIYLGNEKVIAENEEQQKS